MLSAITIDTKPEVLQFVKFLEDEKKVTPNTLDSYGRDVWKYAQHLEEKNSISSLIQAGTKELKEYFEFLKKHGMSPSTLSRNLASIRSFYRFLQKTKQQKNNPTNDIETFKVERKIPQILTETEIEKLFSSIKKISLKGIRDLAMFKLLYGTGLRVSELINLVCENIDYDKKLLLCKRAMFERSIPIDDEIIEAINEYVNKSRPMLVRDEEIPYLFVNCNGSKLTRQGFWKIIKTYKEISGIKKEITPHTLRHSFAYHLLKNGTDIKTLQHMLGHVDVSSTNMYVQMLKMGAEN